MCMAALCLCPIYGQTVLQWRGGTLPQHLLHQHERHAAQHTGKTANVQTESLTSIALEKPSAAVRNAAAEAITGQCGDNLTYSIEGGTLSISGSGTMYDYTVTF